MPKDDPSLVPPLEEGIVKKVMKMYKKSLINELLMNDGMKTEDFLTKYNMKSCCYKLATAWNRISTSDLNRSWNKILGRNEISTHSTAESEDNDIHDLVHKYPGFYDCKDMRYHCWLQETVPGWKTDDKPRFVNYLQFILSFLIIKENDVLKNYSTLQCITRGMHL